MEKNQDGRVDRRTFLMGVGLGAAVTLAAPAIVSAQSEPKTGKKDSA